VPERREPQRQVLQEPHQQVQPQQVPPLLLAQGPQGLQAQPSACLQNRP
jgi:hypothetical protein